MNFKKIVKNDFFGRVEDYILDQKTGDEFQRIAGGFGWPSAFKPGFAVVIGEDRKEDELFKKRHYRVLAEYENQSPIELIKRCAELSSLYIVAPWYGDTGNRAMMEFLYNSPYRINLIDAPLLDEPNAFETYLLQIREATNSVKKILHFGGKSHLPPILAGLNPQDIPNTNKIAFQNHPQITALGFAVSALEVYSYDPGQQAEVDRLNAELVNFHDD